MSVKIDFMNINTFELVKKEIINNPKTWLITGVAGFIGSNILEELLNLNQKVIGLDNLSTGHLNNLDDVRNSLTKAQWNNFQFIEGDIRKYQTCIEACTAVDHVLHQAALGSVPRSITDPLTTNEVNISGFINMLYAAKESKVQSFTYAASSSSYGDHEMLPKVEEVIGSPLSPYAVSKYVNELYACAFNKVYDFNSIGLRYFNVFGKRQDPNGAYAAVIPKWIDALKNKRSIEIYGDGETSRDFCYIDNAVQANLLSAYADKKALNQVYNVAYGDRTSLNDLYKILASSLVMDDHAETEKFKKHIDFRKGDVMHSQADISKAKKLIGYRPKFSAKEGLIETIRWYLKK